MKLIRLNFLSRTNVVPRPCESFSHSLFNLLIAEKSIGYGLTYIQSQPNFSSCVFSISYPKAT